MIVPFPMAFFSSATPANRAPEVGKEAPASGDTVTDADILLGLVGGPLPWWRHIGW